MKKYLVFLSVLIFMCSLNTYAKATYDFEDEGEDTVFIASESHFTIFERTSAMANNGSYAVMAVLEDTGGDGGDRWTFYTRDQDDSLLSDLVFMDDTVFFWMYLPTVAGGVMDFIQPFTQDVGWRWHGAWQSYGSVTLDAWDCYPVHIDTLMYDGSTMRELPIIRSGVEFGTLVNEPGCTIYIDDISTWERGTSGITILTDSDKVILEASINTIKFSLADPTPVLVSVYNLMGAKVAEVAPGAMNAGSHEISVDVPVGMYIVKVVAGQVRATNKLLVLE